MIIACRLFFSVVLITMLITTTWAGWQVPLWEIPGEVGRHPWFIATLVDAYWGFLTFYLWVVYRESTWSSRLLWLVTVLALGNIAMAIYVLAIVLRLPRNASPERILLRGEPHVSRWIPAGLMGALLAISGLAALS